MRFHKEDQMISINTEENVIKFSRKFERNACDHKNIQISAEENEVLCTDCNVRLNPVWWIEKHLKYLNQAAERNNRVLSEAREIYKKLEKKNSFMCKHCHEVNLIDFKKLPSQAAITRGMSVVEHDHAGMTVEIER